MGHIFVSYSRRDSSTVDTIISCLKQDGFNVWVDRESIKGGNLWRIQIVEAIDGADAFVLMISPNSVASDNVRKEVDLAESANRRIFPVLLSAVELPPQLRYQLAGIQWIDYGSDPHSKYAELAEALRSHQRELGNHRAPETRELELVISGANLKKFGATEQEKLLNFIAQLTETPRAELRLKGLSAGSVHAVINMPVRSAYMMKTAALNRDTRLIEYGITAIRLAGEASYVLIQSGLFGSLPIKAATSSMGKTIFMVVASLAILIGLTRVLGPIIPRPGPVTHSTTVSPSDNPTFTPTASRKPTSTPSSTTTPTRTPTRTLTLTPTDNIPPPIPELISPKSGSIFSCTTDQELLRWSRPKDGNGIADYEVQIDISDGGKWMRFLEKNIGQDQPELLLNQDIFVKGCGREFAWRVRAQDTLGAMSQWSSDSTFVINDKPAMPVVSVKADAWNPPHVVCNPNPKYQTQVQLVWDQPYSPAGITEYEVMLEGQKAPRDGIVRINLWSTIFNSPAKTSDPLLDITPQVNSADFCGRSFQARVRAKDNFGMWGDWSNWFEFSTFAEVKID